MVEYEHDQDQSRARWSTSSSKIFVDLLVEQIQLGNRSGSIFNKKAWKYIKDEFNKQTGLNLERQQLKNHLDVLRKRYNNVKALLDQSGFKWDVTETMVIANDDVWKKYIEAHPEAEAIKSNGCPIFEQLCIIFLASGVNESVSISSPGTTMHQTGAGQFRAKWTSHLEKIFAHLMFEQVRQGNRSNNAFTKKAWKYMHNEFNRKTGLKFDMQQLKNHHGVLRRLYICINSLLDQKGFNWDKSRCLVIAEDELWEKHIQEHPEIEAIRAKGCPLYYQLEKIFSEPGDEERDALFDQQIVIPKMDSPTNQDQYKQDQSRARWTPSLDKIFVDLLVDHQKRSVSNKKAWKRIRDEFNGQTGLNFDEHQLRNHQSVLRKLYNNIRLLLDQNGFSWNDSQHMVIANDEVWEKYIKVHPEIETIRSKEYPIFKQLCYIFSESVTEGIFVQSGHGVEYDLGIVTVDTPEAASISVAPLVEEASSRSADEVNISDGRNKRRILAPLSCDRQRRIHTETSHTLPDGMLEIASVTNKRATGLAHSGDQFSISSCIKVLNEMQGVYNDLYLAALDLFQDHDRRETFISIKSDMRLAWLKVKCSTSS